MMKHEFEAACGCSVDSEAWTMIDAVYMSFERFDDKNSFYAFYRKHGLEGVVALHKVLAKIIAWERELAEMESELNRKQNEFKMECLVYGIQV